MRPMTRLAVVACALPLAASILTLAGCAQRQSLTTPVQTPDIPHQPTQGALPPWARQADLSQGTLGGYTLTLDAAQATATLTPWRTALANDDLYFLGIDAFLKPDNLRITGIRRTGSTLELDWRFTHPFSAPVDFLAPPSASNRADLGIAAQLLLLADIPVTERPNQTFFGDVVANTSLLLNPAGYTQPKGLLPPLATETNCFPYQLVVDDGANGGAGTRIGKPNPGNQPTGNFDNGIGGWQRSNAGFDRASWTGYGVLHQGQATRGTFVLSRNAMSAGPVAVELAVIAKYQDPRGLPNPRAKRLPALNPDPFTFAYRMPHGALDVEQVTVVAGDALPGEDPTGTTDLTVQVRDWDARAAVTLESDLSLDPQVNTVAQGEPGAPVVEISTPRVSAIVPVGTELNPGAKTGLPGDEIEYTLTVTSTSAPQDGLYPALVRVTDPEGASPTRRDYTTDLGPGLVPITDPGLQVAPVSYMSTVLVVSSGPNLPPTCDGVVPSTGFIEPGGTFTVNLSQIVDDSANLRVRMNYSGPSSSQTSEVIIPYSGIGSETAFNPFTDSRLTQKLTAPTILGTYQLTVQLSDGVNQVDCGPYPFIVGIPGECPTVTSTAPSLGPFIYEDGFNPDFVSIAFALDEDMDTASGIGQNDLAGFRDTSGDLLVQGNVNQQFWRWNYFTDEAIALTTTSYPGPGFANRAHHMEVDGNGRVFWVASNITQSETNPGLETTEIYANAGQVIHFFDTTGAPATADRGNINVGQRVVAMAIDRYNNLWALDSTNTMRKYSGPAGGTTYTEDTSATFSLGTASGGVIAGAVVEDFDINFYNEAFFVLVRGAGGQYNAWRFECDGTYQSSIQGNPNPAMNLFPGETVDRGDIVIDNYGPNMSLLAGPQDAQIVITGDNGYREVLNNDDGLIMTLTARMQKSTVAIGEDGAGRTSFLYAENLTVTTESLSTDDWCESWLEVWIPPDNWQ
ncbi:MAG: hypothetical protein GEEBNDBF_02152 [bacterium]|nr:hypothetical protein [bacterium]